MGVTDSVITSPSMRAWMQVVKHLMRPLTLAMALSAAPLLGCVANSQQIAPIAASCPEQPAARFFPVGSFRDPRWAEGDLFVRRWYSRSLAAMDEPSLSCGPSEASESYRFVWLRSFHSPVAVRVYASHEQFNLAAVILDGQGGYEPGRVIRRVNKQLSRTQWEEVTAIVARLRFWSMPSTQPVAGGMDGAQWIVEARSEDRYHFVDRWSGADGVEAVGLKFLDLAGVRNDVGPIY